MRIVARLLVLLSLLWVEGVWAVDCAGTNYELNSQAEVDALAAEGCLRITGDLVVREGSRRSITNLGGLNVVTVGGDLDISFNDALTNLDGLRVTTVGGDLSIISNSALTNLEGLASITSVGDKVWIISNGALTNLNGLASITTVGGYLTITANGALTNLDGLRVTSVGGDLYIGGNDALTNLDSLRVTSVGGDLDISFNDALTNLDGLANLTNVGRNLRVIDNQSLSNCSALGKVLGAPTGPPNDSVGGQINISDNVEGCNSVEQILASAKRTAFIERFYVNILNRPSDPAGLEAWLNVINTQSASAVALGFLNSAEFKNRGLNNAAFVDILYRTLFDREGDPEGVNFWLSELASGRLRDMVIWGFLRAAEFKTLSDSFGVTALSPADESAYGVRAFTERFYTLVLGRHPDQAGFDGWVTALSAKTLSGGDLAKAFFLSAEYAAKNTTNSDFVETAYQAFFGRAADVAGKQGWLDLMARGMSRTEVLDGFSGSQEFIALAESYGIATGAHDDCPTSSRNDCSD